MKSYIISEKLINELSKDENIKQILINNNIMSELYTIDKTPNTDLEKFQALRIEALERELERARILLLEIKSAMETYTNNIDVEAEIVDDFKDFSA